MRGTFCRTEKIALLPAARPRRRQVLRDGHPDADAAPCQGVDKRWRVERRDGHVLERLPGMFCLAAGSRVEGDRGLLQQTPRAQRWRNPRRKGPGSPGEARETLCRSSWKRRWSRSRSWPWCFGALCKGIFSKNTPCLVLLRPSSLLSRNTFFLSITNKHAFAF
jgi:hypothetical protein